MGNLHLVTGHKGEAHVTPPDHGSFHAAIFGEGQYVLKRGSQFASTIITNNQIRIADGDILMQGRHIRLNEGSYVDLTIENGAQGYYRNDLIVVRYTKDSMTGVEECNLVVIKGTVVERDPVDPDYTIGDIINDHVLIADMPLYRVPLDGLTVQTLIPLFEIGGLEPPDGSITKVKIAAGATYSAITVNLAANGWSNYKQTVNAKGVTSNNAVIVSPNPSSYAAYTENGIRCTVQASGTLTFECKKTPSVAVSVNVVILT
jgi:hypothetical protein